MLYALDWLAGINVSPSPVPPRASDYAALDRGEVVKRVEPVKGAAVPRVRAYIVIDAPPQKMFAQPLRGEPLSGRAPQRGTPSQGGSTPNPPP